MSPHTIALRSKDNSRLDYRISVSGDIAARTGITGEDSAHNSVATGSVGGGVDVWDYSGARTEIVVSSASAQLSINGGAWTDGEKFGEVVVREPAGGDGAAAAPTPNDPPDMDKYQAVELGAVGKDEAIGGGAWHGVGDDENPRVGFVSRFQTTTQDQTIHIDENDAGGVQAALNRLPYHINHRVTIKPSDGVHGGNGSAIRTHPMTIGSAGDLIIEGNHRDQCRVEQGINSVSSGKQLNYRIRGVSFLGLSQFSGPVDLRECRFEGFDRAGANSSGTAAISGKNGQIHAKRCVLGGDTDQYSIWATIQEHYTLLDCALNARDAAINASLGCSVETWGCDFNAPRERT